MNQKGIDYASVDENSPPDFVQAYQAGTRFAIIRKSFIQYDAQHKAYHLAPDPAYARDTAHARNAGLTVGSYVFVSFNKGAPSAAEQISNLKNAPGDILHGKDFPPCIDVEFPGKGITDTGRTQAEAFAFLLELIAEVRSQFGVSPMIYTSHVQWHDDNGLGGPDASALDGCPLWIKTPYRLVARRPADTVPATSPYIGFLMNDIHGYWSVPTPWVDQGWWVQQDQGDVIGWAGFDKTVDRNQFYLLSAANPVDANTKARTTWVQKRLGITTDGAWGSDTTKALESFQTQHGLQSDGIIGPATFAALCW